MTTTITIENTEGPYEVRVSKFHTSANGERLRDGEIATLKPGEKRQEYIHGTAMVEVTKGPYIETKSPEG